MKVNYVKLTAGVLTGFMALSSVPYAVYAAGPTAGVASYTSDLSLIHIYLHPCRMMHRLQ